MQTLAYMAIKFLVHSKTVNQSQSPKESGRSDLHFPIFRSFKWWVKTCCSTNLYRDRGAQRCRDSGSFGFWIGDRSFPWFIHFSSFFHTVKICKARRWHLFPYPLSLCLHSVFEILALTIQGRIGLSVWCALPWHSQLAWNTLDRSWFMMCNIEAKAGGPEQ